MHRIESGRAVPARALLVFSDFRKRLILSGKRPLQAKCPQQKHSYIQTYVHYDNLTIVKSERLVASSLCGRSTWLLGKH